MIKLIITAGLVYFVYKYFIAPVNAVQSGPRQEKVDPAKKKKDDTDGEYVDYEEVD
ncbi:MAG: hypothetical protein R2828_14840 [Saprospiraceae bacterium]